MSPIVEADEEESPGDGGQLRDRGTNGDATVPSALPSLRQRRAGIRLGRTKYNVPSASVSVPQVALRRRRRPATGTVPAGLPSLFHSSYALPSLAP